MQAFALPLDMLGGEEQPSWPQPEAAALTLRERYATLLAPPATPLRPGDLVVPKPGFDFRKEEITNQPMLLVEIDPSWSDLAAFRKLASHEKPRIRERFRPEPAEYGSIAFDLDCMVMTLGRDGTAVTRLYSSQLLTHWTGVDEDNPTLSDLDPAGVPDPNTDQAANPA